MPFSIVIPVYNEEEIIEENTKKLMDFLDKTKKDYEIIIVDNGSTDKTKEKGLELKRKYPGKIKFSHLPERGAGQAFKSAAALSSYSDLVSIDMDLSTDLSFIPRCLDLLKENSIVVGSKTVGFQERPFYRKFISNTYIFLTKSLLGLNFSDYSLGAKGYRKRDVMDKIKKIDSGSFYVTQLIYFVKQEGKNVTETPVSCHDVRKSKFNLLNEVIYRLRSLLSFWFREKIINRIIKTPA